MYVWIDMDKYVNMPVNIESFDDEVAILPVDEVESIIQSGGFSKPTLYFQSLLLHAWFSKYNSCTVLNIKYRVIREIISQQ